MLKLTRLFKQTTGHNEQPTVQQQKSNPQTSQRTFPDMLLANTPLILRIVSASSSGAKRPVNTVGNSVSNRELRPNLKPYMRLLKQTNQ